MGIQTYDGARKGQEKYVHFGDDNSPGVATAFRAEQGEAHDYLRRLTSSQTWLNAGEVEWMRDHAQLARDEITPRQCARIHEIADEVHQRRAQCGEN